MTWLSSIVKWLAQYLLWRSSHTDTKRTRKKFLDIITLRMYSVNNFQIYHKDVLMLVIILVIVNSNKSLPIQLAQFWECSPSPHLVTITTTTTSPTTKVITGTQLQRRCPVNSSWPDTHASNSVPGEVCPVTLPRTQMGLSSVKKVIMEMDGWKSWCTLQNPKR